MRYQLRIQVQLTQVRDDGAYMGGGTNLEQVNTVALDDWSGVADVIGQFHQLGGDLEREHPAR